MWPGVRPALFGEISSGKKYGGKTPVVRVPVARCPAVKWVDTMGKGVGRRRLSTIIKL